MRYPFIHPPNDGEISLKTVFITILCFIITTAASAMPGNFSIAPESPSQRTVQLEELWRVGGEDDEDILFGVVASGALDAQGNVYLLDTQLSQVLVINPEGELINTLGREGEGPGEMSRPIGIFINNESQIGIAQGFPGKIILLNTDGTPGGTIPINQDSESGGFAFLARAVKRENNLVVLHGKGTFDMESGEINTVNLLTGIDDDGKELARFAEHTQLRDMNKQVFDEAANFSELTTWALGNNCVYTIPDRNKYNIHMKTLDGEMEGSISRNFESRKRRDEDKEDLTSGMAMVFNGRQLEVEKHILDYDQAILGLNVATDGRLFVQNCYQAPKRLPEGTAGRFDIIDTKGIFVEELILEIPGFDPQQDGLSFMDGEYFLYLKGLQAATNSMQHGLMGSSAPEEEVEEDVEPLEVIFCRIPK